MKPLSIFILIIILVVNSFVFVSASNDDSLSDINSSSYILYESNRGQILAFNDINKNYVSRLCSIIMTAILTYENSADITEYITISNSYNDLKNTPTKLIVGSKYRLLDLVHSLLLDCSLDVAYVLAEHISDNSEIFTELMNQKAQNIGLKDTYFNNSNNIFAEKTTINDIAKLITYALNNPLFQQIFTTDIYVWENKFDNENVIISNNNNMFWVNESVTGGLRCDIDQSNYFTTITSASYNNLNLIAITFNNDTSSFVSDLDSLFNYGFSNFRRGILAKKDEVIWSVNIEEHTVNLVPNMDILYTFPVIQSTETYISDVKYKLNSDIKFPIDTTTPIAEVSYYLQDNTEIKFNLYSTKEILVKDSTLNIVLDKLKEQKDIYNIIKILLLLLFIQIILKLYKLFKNLKL